MDKIIIICGPTASGKTALAVECAKLLSSEVVSADSLYIYKGLDIGTAKPTLDEMCGVKHHLINVADTTSDFTVSDYRVLALNAITSIINKGKIPVICGGTGFYINSILYDLSYGNSQGDESVREYYKNLAQEKGNAYVYDILKEKDILSAEKIHFNDIKRVIRALEICATGTKKSDIVDDMSPKFDYRAYSLNYDRETLYNRINLRVNQMIDDGLIDEVKSLLLGGVTKNHQCMQGIGYKEVIKYIEGKMSLFDTIEKIKLNTRHYAKRQITFFKKLPRINYIKPNDVKIIAKEIVEDKWIKC